MYFSSVIVNTKHIKELPFSGSIVTTTPLELEAKWCKSAKHNVFLSLSWNTTNCQAKKKRFDAKEH